MNIIFDWSGTLADDQKFTWQITNSTLKHFNGEEVSYETYRQEFKIPVDNFYEKHLPNGFSKEVDEYFFSCYLEKCDSINLFSGISELIKILSSHHTLYILSTINSMALEKAMKRLNILTHFKKILGDAFDKRIVLPKLIQEEHLNRHETFFIGDTDHDIISAKQASIRSAAVGYGYSEPKSLKAQNPDYFFDDVISMTKNLNKIQLIENSPLPIVTVGGLVFNEMQEALLVKTEKWSNLFGTPGGKVEKGESLQDAFIREIKEETGLDIFDIQFVFNQDCIYHKEFYKPMHFVLVNYIARCNSFKVKLNYESVDFLWSKIDDLDNTTVNEPTLKLIKEIQKRKLIVNVR